MLPGEASRLHASRLEEEVSSLIDASRLTETARGEFDPATVVQHPEVVAFLTRRVIPYCPAARATGEVPTLFFIRCLLEQHKHLLPLDREQDVVALTTDLYQLLKCKYSKRLDYLRLDDLTAKRGLLGVLQQSLKRLADPGKENRPQDPLHELKLKITEFADTLFATAQQDILQAFDKEFTRLRKKQDDLSFINSRLEDYVRRLK
jgi:hypothetical protein